METIELEKRLNDFIKTIHKEIVEDIDKAGHHGSGVLTESIKVKLEKSTNGYKINIESLNYLQYLDGGELLNKFIIKLEKELDKIILDSISTDILNSF